MSRHVLVIVALGFASIVSAAESAKSAKSSGESVTIHNYQISLPSSWKVQNYKPPKHVIVAVRSHNGKPIGEIMASRLEESVDKESTEMVASAKKNPNVFKLLDKGDFKLESKVKGKRVLLAIRASDPKYGSPLIFYSIYLPRKDGGCVTFKLRCGASQFETMKPEFEKIVAGAKAHDKKK